MVSAVKGATPQLVSACRKSSIGGSFTDSGQWSYEVSRQGRYPYRLHHFINSCERGGRRESLAAGDNVPPVRRSGGTIHFILAPCLARVRLQGCVSANAGMTVTSTISASVTCCASTTPRRASISIPA